MNSQPPGEMQWVFSEEDGLLRVETWGPVPLDLEDGLAYLESIRDRAAGSGAFRILVDRRRVVQRPGGNGSELLLERVAEMFAEAGFDRDGHRVAVMTPSEHLPNVRSAETLFNAHGVHIRYFSHEDDALAWLREQ